MKKIFFALTLFSSILFFTAGNTHALSFMQGTRFLEAKTEVECKKLGGNYMEWYGEIYCTKAPFYNTFEDFIKAEPSCKRATDGCNSVGIINGELGAMTQMYCEDTYGPEGKEEWECLDIQIEQDTLGFMSENDRNYYKTLQSQIEIKNQERVLGLITAYGDTVLEKYSWNVLKSVKLIERTVEAFENAIFELSLKTPADATMSETDTMKYSILQYAKFELQIMMHRWIRNAGM